MYRKFKFFLRLILLAGFTGLWSSTITLGYLTRKEAFEQSFDLVWSTVHESHWDETFGGLDWEKTRKTYYPKLRRIRKRADLVRLMQKMLDELDLSHYKVLSNFVEPLDNHPRGGYVGLELKYIGGQAYVTRVDEDSPAADGGVMPGWRLKSIHSRSIKRLVSPFLKADLSERKRTFYIQRYLNDVVQGGPNRKIRTDWYPPAGRALKVYMIPEFDERQESEAVGYLPSQRIEYQQTYLEGDVMYIRFNYFLPQLMSDIRDSIESASGTANGIIIDLRGNSGGMAIMATGITGLLVDEQTTLGTLVMKKGYISYQGYPQAKRYRGPVAILVDGSSVSTSEMLAAGLQEAGRARLFGEITLGESLPSLFKKLPSGDVLQYAVGDYHTPGGYRIEKNGVVPDEILIPEVKQLETGLDLPLQKATEWILKQNASEENDAS
ncbi:MAG: S41 family peptidase [Verrucomicrobia bacterium]|nr:S41 family peptidase [Verrucomicrobiota bacterium]